MSTLRSSPPQRIWSAQELRRLPHEERDAVLASAALAAEPDYRSDRSLTAFEAFGEDDLHGDSSDSRPRAERARPGIHAG